MGWIELIVSNSITITATYLVTILTTTNDAIKVGRSVWRIIIKKKPQYSFEKESKFLSRTSNPRFGFSFMEIKSWDKILPANGDGNTFIYSYDPNVIFKVWGQHNVLQDNDDLEGLASNYLNTRGDNSRKLITKRETSCEIIDYSFDDAEYVTYQETIQAYRLIYTYKEKNVRMKVVTKLTVHNGIVYNVYFSAPSKKFKQYEELCDFLIASFYILGPNNAPRTAV